MCKNYAKVQLWTYYEPSLKSSIHTNCIIINKYLPEILIQLKPSPQQKSSFVPLVNSKYPNIPDHEVREASLKTT